MSRAVMAYPEGPKAKKDPPPRVDLGWKEISVRVRRSRREGRRKEVQIATWLDSTPKGGVRSFWRSVVRGNRAKLKENHSWIA